MPRSVIINETVIAVHEKIWYHTKAAELFFMFFLNLLPLQVAKAINHTVFNDSVSASYWFYKSFLNWFKLILNYLLQSDSTSFVLSIYINKQLNFCNNQNEKKFTFASSRSKYFHFLHILLKFSCEHYNFLWTHLKVILTKMNMGVSSWNNGQISKKLDETLLTQQILHLSSFVPRR